MPRPVKYLLLLLLVMAAGLLSRKMAGVPLFVGDMLYAVIVYVLVCYLWRRGRAFAVAAVSGLLCYAVEASQLVQVPWLVALRSTTLGRLALGQGFLWEDIAAYTLAVLLCAVVVRLTNRREARR